MCNNWQCCILLRCNHSTGQTCCHCCRGWFALCLAAACLVIQLPLAASDLVHLLLLLLLLSMLALVIVLQPPFTVIKTGPSTVLAGEVFDYNLIVTFFGAARGVVVVDDLPLQITPTSRPGSWTSVTVNAQNPSGGALNLMSDVSQANFVGDVPAPHSACCCAQAYKHTQVHTHTPEPRSMRTL